MAIKPPDLLNRLPSVAELLEKPPIRALAERWNRSTVAGGVRSFLEELRTDFERRTAAIPSIRELAERAARYVVSRQHHALGIAINATGQVDSPLWSSTPLAEPALERMIALGREYATESAGATSNSREELQRTLCRLTNAGSAAVVHSYSAAIWLALATLAPNREMIVAREDHGDDSLRKLAEAAHVALKEVGGHDRITVDDVAASVSARSAGILIRHSGAPSTTGETSGLEIGSLVRLAHERQLVLIDELGAAPIVDLPAPVGSLGRSAAASLAMGAALVILRGDALVGGPPCGIVLGRGDLIQRIIAHPLFESCEIDPLRAAALTATLACYDTRDISPPPVWQCLNTSVENLRNRAERLATQLAHAEGIEAAVATETRSAILAARGGEGMPSYGVALTPNDANVAALEQRLLSAKIPIRGRIDDGRIILDLRTVLARQDKLIVDSLLGASTAEPSS